MRISDYEPIVGKIVIEELRILAQSLSGRIIQNVNSTALGGGVAEILRRIVPLLQDLGINAQWDVIRAQTGFFEVTKKFHNALHGRPTKISKKDYKIFMDVSQQNIKDMNLYGDIIFVHDPQPVALIKRKKTLCAKWLWRCHIDLSNPQKDVWRFLKGYVEQYESAVFSSPLFAQRLPIRQFLISPSVDPLSDKNIDLSQETIREVFGRYGVSMDRSIVSQISRFDHLKDPLGVIDAFRLVRKYVNCQLILAGSHAADDPESCRVLEQVREKSGKDPDIHVLIVNPETNDIDVNAIQRGSDVIVQKSTKEGFALTVTEALWKARPVVASAVGGIPLQIKHKFSGLLCHTVEGCAHYVKQFLQNPEYARRLGENGKQHIKNNFLLTRHLRDHMLAFLALDHPQDVVYL